MNECLFTANLLLQELEQNGARFELAGDEITFRGPRGVLTDALQQQLRSNKPLLRQLLRSRNGTPIPPVGDEAETEVPLSHAQRRLWVLAQMDGGSGAYNMSGGYLLVGDFRSETFKRAFTAIVQRHESLRTTFTIVGGQPLQRISHHAKIIVEELDLTRAPDRDRKLHALVAEEQAHIFDLERGPLVRAKLVRLAEDRWAFLLTLHHIISDGWSMGILVTELLSAYEAMRRDQPFPLPPLEIQYRDFTQWQNRQLIEGKWLPARSYWHQKLAGDLPILDLPTDRPRPALKAYRGQVHRFSIAALPELKALTKKHASTLFMALVAMTKALLFRYTQQRDIIIATPVAGRSLSVLRQQVGLYIGVLPLRDQINDADAFVDLLGRVRTTVLEAYQHQDYPFDLLVEELRVPRDLSRHPIFDVMISMDDGWVKPSLPGLEMTPLPVDTLSSKFDVSIQFQEAQHALQVEIEYDRELFDSDRIARMGQHFQTLTQSILCAPSQPIGRLAMLPPWEHHSVTDGFNNTTTEYPSDRTVADLFEAQVVKTPDAPALVHEGQSVTYSELNGYANGIAATLRAQGLESGHFVGVMLQRSVTMVATLLAVMKSGAAYVPIDADYPAERIRYVLEDSGCALLVSEPEYRDQWAGFSGKVVLPPWQNAAANPVRDSVRDRLAYIIYTSGSTGKPKGVMVEQRQLVNFLESMRHKPGLTERDVVLAITTISFDIAALEIFLPLVCGARVILATRDDAVSPEKLAILLESYAVTVMQATPVTWRVLIGAGWTGRAGLKALCGGEPLPPELARDLIPRVFELWNMYGPTETTVWSTISRIVSCDDRISIGTPIANTRVYVLDAQMEPVPIAVNGELWIAGAGVARGYWNQPSLTETRFLPDPFSPGTRMYRTGDIARWLPDGTLQCLGRTDGQVKIRGYRIETGEIESQLKEHSDVADAVVVARELRPGEGPSLCAYYVPRAPENGAAPSPASPPAIRPLEFSLFYFSGDGTTASDQKYNLLIEGAKFADAHGFAAVWTPERHFHAFGGLFPNPSVLGAALAMVTRNVQIRAGSIVVPLHDPIRIVEEWSVVDNLSGGRVGVAFASGWHVDDFALAPEHYENRRTVLRETVATVRRLWSGDEVSRTAGNGRATRLRVLPRPLQAELPLWITAAGSEEGFRYAGEIGANVLTHLLGQSLEELGRKIAIYRKARSAAGLDGATGRVAVMVHTFVGDDIEEVRAAVKAPFQQYLRASTDLMAQFAKTQGADLAAIALKPEDEETFYSRAFDRYFGSAGLMGTPETCRGLVENLRAISVDEVACLVDFGIDANRTLKSLENLARFKDDVSRRANETAATHLPWTNGAHAATDEFRHFLQQKLPAYMIPEAFVPIPEMPLTSNGKIDRNRLPTPLLERQAYEPPRDEVEIKLAEIFAEVLAIGRVGIDDDFFKLGGNSLKAIQIGARIQQELSIDLRLSALFDATTVRKLGVIVKQRIDALLQETT